MLFDIHFKNLLALISLIYPASEPHNMKQWLLLCLFHLKYKLFMVKTSVSYKRLSKEYK